MTNQINGKSITNRLERANLFNQIFNEQCHSVPNSRALPKFNTYHTLNRLSGMIFDNEKIVKIIQTLDAKKSSWLRRYFNKDAKAK